MTPLSDSFAELVGAFCAWCERGAEPISRAQAERWFARLHASALELPDVEPTDDLGPPDVPEAALEAAKARIAPLWGSYYRMVFDPNPLESDTPVVGDLGDDLQDVYLDLRRGLAMLNHGEVENAIWYWKFSHQTHWGRHATEALYAIHAYFNNDRADSPLTCQSTRTHTCRRRLRRRWLWSGHFHVMSLGSSISVRLAVESLSFSGDRDAMVLD